MSADEKPQLICGDCRHTHKAIAWQRVLLLDLANKLGINLKDLEGRTAEDEWEALGKRILERVGELNAGS